MGISHLAVEKKPSELGTTNNQRVHNTTEWPKRLVTFETFDQSDEETWPDQKRSTYLPAYLPTYIPTHLPTYVPPLENTLKEQS